MDKLYKNKELKGSRFADIRKDKLLGCFKKN
jgi:hypothetical protein